MIDTKRIIIITLSNLIYNIIEICEIISGKLRNGQIGSSFISLIKELFEKNKIKRTHLT